MNTLNLRAALFAAALTLGGTALHAQNAEPLDAAAARAALSQQPKKSRFTPKAAIKSRIYTRNAKGAGVEIIEYEPVKPGDAPVREERPYIAVPILFVRAKDDLLDAVSVANVQRTAAILRELMAADPKAKFTIQGHTSAEGDAGWNQILSQDRAQKIYSLLVEGQGVDGSRLAKVGFGPTYASVPADASEDQRQQDRRVLVVRQ